MLMVKSKHVPSQLRLDIEVSLKFLFPSQHNSIHEKRLYANNAQSYGHSSIKNLVVGPLGKTISYDANGIEKCPLSKISLQYDTSPSFKE